MRRERQPQTLLGQLAQRLGPNIDLDTILWELGCGSGVKATERRNPVVGAEDDVWAVEDCSRVGAVADPEVESGPNDRPGPRRCERQSLVAEPVPVGRHHGFWTGSKDHGAGRAGQGVEDSTRQGANGSDLDTQ